ncbi:MAG: ATP synthase F0 subunit B [Chloracidobacterium sp.]|uniref:ATP synthase subunit b n=1 Tax=Chloracidobacterium validum TaxID=2821543 RepID=A0ABX8B576_9BACT|nr:ATP synthase F0 subunit B [Chloracidobacterium validum]QUW02124.1 ATP synthase F0 subunit B [Chloracidobacterium validum]
MTLATMVFWAAGIPLWAKFLNFAIYAGLLAFFLAKPIAEGLRKRAQNILEALDRAGQERALAETKLRELEDRFARLESELADIRQQAEQAAQAEHDRIVAAAEADAERLRKLAKMEIEGATKAARLELQAFAAATAVELAESLIRRELSSSDQSRLVASYTNQLGKQRV